jgi:hypothetical protein
MLRKYSVRGPTLSDVHKRCPLCFQELKQTRENNGCAAGVDCPRCGQFKIAVPLLGNLNDEERRQLAGVTREAHDLGRLTLLITEESRHDLIASVPRRIQERAVHLLAAIARRTEFFGDRVELFREDDVPLVYAKNFDEFASFVNYLDEAQLIKRDTWTTGPSVSVTVTARGFEMLETRHPTGAESDSAFVAMSFCGSLQSVFLEGIRPAIKDDCGFRPVRIDLEEHNDDIIDRVFAEIRKSRFVVADFSQHRNGVYFEAGYAMGLSIPVIWLCRKSEMASAHFDTEHFNHIAWESESELRDRLATRIQATIGMGPLAGGTG